MAEEYLLIPFISLIYLQSKVIAQKEGRREQGRERGRREGGREERKESQKHEEMAGMTNNGSMEAQRYQAPVVLLALQ